MKGSAILAAAMGVFALLVAKAPALLSVTAADSRFFALLTITAGVLTVLLLWWWAASEITYAVARRSQNRNVLRVLQRFATPRVRRMAAVSLALPSLLLTTPALATEASPGGRDITIDLSWGAELPASASQQNNTAPEITNTGATENESDGIDVVELVSKPLNENSTAVNDLNEPHPAPAYDDSPSRQSNGTWVVVAPGDTLWSIAREHTPHDSDIPALITRIWDANRIVIGNNPHLILPGQELYIP